MRIFVGIPISQKLQKEVSQFLAEFSILNSKFLNNVQFPNSKIKFIKPENLHITLAPPWEADENQVQSICRSLAGARDDIEPFNIRFTRIELGPNKHQPRMIWATGEDSQEIINLKQTIENHLNLVNIIDGRHLSKQKYRLHCTLARLNSRYGREANKSARYGFGTLKKAPLPQEVSWQMEVLNFVLYESKLLPGGAEYRVIQEFKLG